MDIPINVGDKFYCNFPAVKAKMELPDHLIVTRIEDVGSEIKLIHAKYENHYINTNERVFSNIILKDSNRNPEAKDPQWIFM